jgi:hypothetical protein
MNFDGFVKSPHAALRRILRHCSVPQVRFIPCGFARLACELFTKPSENRLFMKSSILKASQQAGDDRP